MKPLALFVLLAALLLSASDRASAVTLVVTVRPLALLLEPIAGDRAEIHVLVPPGASPHSFEPKPSDLIRVARADAFVSVGGGLDDWSSRLFLTAGPSAKAQSLFEMIGRHSAAAVDRGGKSVDHHTHGDETSEDPHLWLDPILVQREIVPALIALMSDVDPAGASHYAQHGSAFRNQLAELNEELRSVLGAEARQYVAFHAAWKHFAARYSLEEIAVVQEAPGEQPTPRELANLVRAAQRVKLGAILVEPQLDPRIARTLSSEFGGTTVLVDPLGDPSDPERSTYAGLLRFNARAFRHAMALNAQRSPPL